MNEYAKLAFKKANFCSRFFKMGAEVDYSLGNSGISLMSLFPSVNYNSNVGVVVEKYYEERSESERYDKFVIVVEREVVQENGEITTVQEEHKIEYKHYEQMVIGTVVTFDEDGDPVSYELPEDIEGKELSVEQKE